MDLCGAADVVERKGGSLGGGLGGNRHAGGERLEDLTASDSGLHRARHSPVVCDGGRGCQPQPCGGSCWAIRKRNSLPAGLERIN